MYIYIYIYFALTVLSFSCSGVKDCDLMNNFVVYTIFFNFFCFYTLYR